MKSMEEQIRRQEARIQGIVDSIAADKRSLEDRINAVNVELSGKMDTMIAAISAQIANAANANRSRGILGTPETGGSRDTGMNLELLDKSFKNPKMELSA